MAVVAVLGLMVVGCVNEDENPVRPRVLPPPVPARSRGTAWTRRPPTSAKLAPGPVRRQAIHFTAAGIFFGGYDAFMLKRTASLALSPPRCDEEPAESMELASPSMYTKAVATSAQAAPSPPLQQLRRLAPLVLLTLVSCACTILRCERHARHELASLTSLCPGPLIPTGVSTLRSLPLARPAQSRSYACKPPFALATHPLRRHCDWAAQAGVSLCGGRLGL